MSGRRVLVTTLIGFIFGIISYLLARGAEGMNCGSLCGVSLTGPVLGFLIGISGWRINFVIHGLILGAIVFFPVALTSGQFLRYWLLGVVYGGLIESLEHFFIRETISLT